MTQTNLRLFFGSFFLTLILITGLCGFIMVDLSTDRYMPGDFEPAFLVSELGPEGIGVSLMGTLYRVDATGLLLVEETAFPLSYLLPRSARLSGAAAAQGVESLRQVISSMEEDEP